MIGHCRSWLVVSCVALAGGLSAILSGCSSSEPPPPPINNKNVVSAAGEYVGHLKPNAYMATGDTYPVIWVVRGDEVEHRDDKILVNAFRLDFDETKPLTEADLPYSLMTEDTHEVVVHRGKPASEIYTNPKIHEGERCLPIYECGNPECPRVKELNDVALIPGDPTADEIKCPHCGGSKYVRPYTMPQHRDMVKFINKKQ